MNAKERSEAFLTSREYRGDHFIEQVPGGSRVNALMNKGFEVQSGNRALMFTGLLLTFTACSASSSSGDCGSSNAANPYLFGGN